MGDLQKGLIKLYIEYVNDYLTIDRIATNKGLDRNLMLDMINEGNILYHNCLRNRQDLSFIDNQLVES